MKEVKLSFDQNEDSVMKYERYPNGHRQTWSKTAIKMIVAGNMEKSYKEIMSYFHGINKLLRRFCYFSVEIHDAKKGYPLRNVAGFHSDRSKLPPSNETVQHLIATIDRYGADINGILKDESPLSFNLEFTVKINFVPFVPQYHFLMLILIQFESTLYFDDRFEIVGQDNVFCHCSIKHFTRNNDSEQVEHDEKSEEKASQEMHEMEMKEVKNSWIRVQVIKNGQLIHPLPERDDVLFILNERIDWKGFGVRRFMDKKWTLTDDTAPTLSRKIATANALYSGEHYRMTITFVINGDDDEYFTEHYPPEITRDLEEVLNRSLNRIKQTVGENGEYLKYSELLYSVREKKLENSASQDVPLIAECLAHILVDAATDSDFDRFGITRNSGRPIDEQVFEGLISKYPQEHRAVYADDTKYPSMDQFGDIFIHIFCRVMRRLTWLTLSTFSTFFTANYRMFCMKRCCGELIPIKSIKRCVPSTMMERAKRRTLEIMEETTVKMTTITHVVFVVVRIQRIIIYLFCAMDVEMHSIHFASIWTTYHRIRSGFVHSAVESEWTMMTRHCQHRMWILRKNMMISLMLQKWKLTIVMLMELVNIGLVERINHFHNMDMLTLMMSQYNIHQILMT